MSNNCCNLDFTIDESLNIPMAISGATYSQPYELPTMTYEAKGGAKLGSGLTVDNEERLTISDNGITSAKLGNSSVTTDKIEDRAVTTAKLNDSAVTTEKIADGAVTASKLDSTVLGMFEGNVKAFDTVADMQAATLEAGNICHTNGFHTAGDGGAAFYKITATGTANGMDVLACGDVFANLIITESYVTPEMFGAWGDGAHDDTSQLQRCFDIGKNITLNKKVYGISSTLNFVNTDYFTLSGSQNKSTIKALDAVDSMIDITNSTSAFFGRKLIEKIVLDGDGKAVSGISCENIRYSSFDLVTFRNITGVALSICNWVVKINNCKFDNCGTGIEIVDGTVNNFVVFESNYSNTGIGIDVKATPNDLHILYSSFDSCDSAGIVMRGGGRNISITGNYFENCGKSGSVNVDTSASTTIQKNGTIVGYGSYQSQYLSNFKNLVITGNCFADCYLNNLLCLSQLCKTVYKNNIVKGSYTYIAELFWIGSYETTSVSNVFEAENTEFGSFEKPVSITSTEKQANISSIIKKQTATELPQEFASIDVMKLVYEATQTGISENGFYNSDKVYTLAGTFDYTLQISLANTSLLNRVANVKCISKGINANNSAWITVKIDNTEVVKTYTLGNNVWKNATRNLCFYIPSTAQTMSIRVKPVYNTSSIDVTDFKVFT